MRGSRDSVEAQTCARPREDSAAVTRRLHSVDAGLARVLATQITGMAQPLDPMDLNAEQLSTVVKLVRRALTARSAAASAKR